MITYVLVFETDVMTTIATGVGLMPIALGFGADPSFGVPTAIGVISGLITSPRLSLFVAPVIFTYVDDPLVWMKQRGLHPDHGKL
jgi:multidrug efflux pump subunit AcrB